MVFLWLYRHCLANITSALSIDFTATYQGILRLAPKDLSGIYYALL